MKSSNNGVQLCDYCGSEKVIRFGSRYCKKGKTQTYHCKNCGKKFSLGGAFKKIKGSKELVADILSLYFLGVSFRGIALHFEKSKGIKVSHSTILRWLRRAIIQIEKFVDTLTPIVGDDWNADEIEFRCADNYHKSLWQWNLLDEETRFLLSSLSSETRTLESCETFLQKAKAAVPKNPNTIVTDGLGCYPSQISKVFKDRTIYCGGAGIRAARENNLLERLHGTQRDRCRPMRGFSRFKSASTIMKGWQIYYNLVKPHAFLNGRTPAEAAQIDLPEYSFKSLLELSQEPLKMGCQQ